MLEAKKEEILRVLRSVDEFHDILCLRAQIDETHYRLGFTETRG